MREQFIKQVPGFHAFTLMETGDNRVVFISSFNTFTDAKASARISQDWHTEHLNEFFQAYSRIAAGEVRVQQSWDAPREADLLASSTAG